MENKKSTLATVLLLIAVLVIGALAGYIYMQKIETDKQISKLQNEKVEMQSKIDDISNNKDEQIDIKESENNLPKTEEVNQIITEFLDLIWTRELGFEEILKKIGYENYREILNNTVKSDNEGDNIYGIYNKNMDKYVGGYSNTKIKYSEFEEKMYNYMTPGILKECFDGTFVEHNGFLYAFIGNASGCGVSNVNIEFIYKNNEQYVYSVKYSVSDAGGIDEFENIISIRKNNNKYVVSGLI